jgi:mannose-1-phosphate guanylyltransferase/mannose-6-phosphate isomerase
MKIIILAGGKGTRLFPLSTSECPKQFLKITDDTPMIISTIKRFEGVVDNKDIIIITNEEYKKLTRDILNQYSYTGINVISEPSPKNTAPAIALGIKFAYEKLGSDGKEVFAILPSDHAIAPVSKFIETIDICKSVAESGSIAVIGIKPDCPDTGYGYINADPTKKCSKVICFVEKPDLAKAEYYFSSGKYFWNAGIYTFTGKVFESELKKYEPGLYDFYADCDYKGFLDKFNGIKSISIDYAVSEKSDNIYMVLGSFDWSDIGNWDNFYKFSNKDEDGNVIRGNVKQQGCKNCLLISNDSDLVAINEKQKIIVSNKGKILSLPMGISQSIKNINCM